MASRHFSLNLSEVADVTDLVVAFQEHNSCRIALELTVGTLGHVPQLMCVVTAFRPVGIGVEPAPLACVPLNTSTMNLKHLRDVVTAALYALDFKLALNEFEGVGKRAEPAPATPSATET